MSDFLDFDELGVDPDAQIEGDYADYQPTTQNPLPAPMGNYTLLGKVPEGLKWGRGGKDKNLYVIATFRILDEGDFSGRFVQGIFGSRKDPWREGNGMTDLLLALNPTAKPAGTNFTVKELGEGIQNSWPKEVKGYLTWEGYCRKCGDRSLKGKKGFTDGAGNVNPLHNCPSCGAVVQAREKVNRVYVA